MIRTCINRFVAAVALGVCAGNAHAALVQGSVLNISTGSYWLLETDVDYFTSTPVTGHAGIVTGTAQSTGLTHPGAPTGTEAISTSIDEPWSFFGNTGMHLTVSPTNVLSASGDRATLDMSGWRWSWIGISAIDVGIDAWNDASLGFTGQMNGIANIVCATDCGNGDTYALNYTGTVQPGSQGFGGERYGLHLQGTISAVPIPAAAWLFGSGLAGLAAVVRRKGSLKA